MLLIRGSDIVHKTYLINTNVACKATWCVVNDHQIDIYKDPKTVTGTPKKSHRGLIRVVRENGHYKVIDRCTVEEEKNDNELKTVFEDGKIVKEFTLSEIRETRRNAVNELFGYSEG